MLQRNINMKILQFSAGTQHLCKFLSCCLLDTREYKTLFTNNICSHCSLFSTYLWKRLSKKLTYFWAVLGSVLLQSKGLALFFHRCYQHLPSPNKTFTQMSAKYCYIIKATSLGFFLILFMSWTHSTFLWKVQKISTRWHCRKPRLGFATLWCSLNPRNPDD